MAKDDPSNMNFPEEIKDKGPKQEMLYLLKDGNMKGKYLGACLDSCRWGSIVTVMYETGVDGLIGFVQEWIRQNEDNFEKIYHKEEIPKDFKLPYIQHYKCPRDDGHEKIINTLDGKIRCNYKTEESYKPSFVTVFENYDMESQMKKKHYDHMIISHSIPDDAWDDNTGEIDSFYKEDLKQYEKQIEVFENEKETFIVTDTCNAIISDKKSILPLETIIKRLNLRPETYVIYCGGRFYGSECKRIDELDDLEKEIHEISGRCLGHTTSHEYTEFSFDGWALADYVQRWYEQSNNPPIYEKEQPVVVAFE